MSTATVTKLELPLDSDVWGLLQDEAAKVGKPPGVLASDVVRQWIRERHRQRIAQEIAEFAAAHAGSELDLDRQLEDASLETLGEEEP